MIHSQVQGTGIMPDSFGDLRMAGGEHTQIGEKISIIFLGNQSLRDFTSTLLSDAHNTFHAAAEKAVKQSFDDCYNLAEEFDRLLGFTELEDSPISIHCDEIANSEQAEDLDISNSCLVIVYGGFENKEETNSVFEKVSLSLSKSILVNCTDFYEVKEDQFRECVFVNPKQDLPQESHVEMTLDMIRFMFTDAGDDSLKEEIKFALKDFEDIRIIASSSKNGKNNWQDKFRQLKDRQRRKSNSFDRKIHPISYQTGNESRNNYAHWLDNLRNQLYETDEDSLSVEVKESFNRLSAICYRIRSKDNFSLFNNKKNVEYLEFDIKQCSGDDWNTTVHSLREFYGNDIKSNRAFYGAGHISVSEHIELGKHAKFQNWDAKDKKSNLFNFSPYFWKIFDQLNILMTALGRYGSQTETKDEKYLYWISPTMSERFNQFQLDFEVRRRFLQFNEQGGYLGWN